MAITSPIGSTERTNELLQEASKITGIPAQTFPLSIPKNSVSTQIDLSKAPATTPDTSGISAMIGGFLNQFQGQNQQITDAMKGTQQNLPKTSALANIFSGLQKQREDLRASQSSQQELYTQTLSQFGFTPERFAKQQELIGQMTIFQQQQATIEAEKNSRILGAEQQYAGRLSSLLRGEQGLIERQYNSKIAAVAGQAAVVGQQYQLERGMFQDAMQMTDKIVDLATFDQKQKLADLDWVKDTYVDLFNMMDKEENEQWDRTYGLAKDELDTRRQEERDKIEDAFKNRQLAISEDKSQKNNNDLFTTTQLNKGAANASVTLEDFNNFDYEAKNYFINNNDAINKVIKEIDASRGDKSINSSELEGEIADSDIPDEVKNYLTNYLHKNSQGNTEKTKSWWQFWK